MSFFESELNIQRWNIEGGQLRILLFHKLQKRFYHGDNLIIKQLEKINGSKLEITCSKCHHCR